MKLIVRISMVFILVSAVLAASSCGSQRMGCPGSITQAEQETPARS